MSVIGLGIRSLAPGITSPMPVLEADAGRKKALFDSLELSRNWSTVFMSKKITEFAFEVLKTYRNTGLLGQHSFLGGLV